jgi:hypothetical protein
MKVMSKRLGLAMAAAFGLAATASAAFVANQPSSLQPGSGSAADCGCIGSGQAGKVACFACCTSKSFEGQFYAVSPDSVLVCFSQCGLERRSLPCRNQVGKGAKLPRG